MEQIITYEVDMAKGRAMVADRYVGMTMKRVTDLIALSYGRPSN